MPVHTPSGRPLLFETYLGFSDVAASGRKVWLAFLPALVVALLMLWLLQLPIALSLARRLRRAHAEREALLLRALNASDTERRVIAADLHDGVVQDLAGTSYALAVAAENVDQTPTNEVAHACVPVPTQHGSRCASFVRCSSRSIRRTCATQGSSRR